MERHVSSDLVKSLKIESPEKHNNIPTIVISYEKRVSIRQIKWLGQYNTYYVLNIKKMNLKKTID